MDGLTEASEILSGASQYKENFSCNLNSVLLGKIIKEIWGENVKLVRRGPRKDRRSCYLNLRPKLDDTELSHETFEQFRESSIELGRGWSKISDHTNTVSFLRCEPWSFNNQRVAIEVRVTHLSSSKFRYSLISHGCESDIANLMDITSIERYTLSQRIVLILKFIDNGQLCRGAPMENWESTTLSHTIGEYVDLTKGTKNVGETSISKSRPEVFTNLVTFLDLRGKPCEDTIGVFYPFQEVPFNSATK